MKNAWLSDSPIRLWSMCVVAAIICSVWANQALAAGLTHRYGEITITELDIPIAASSHGYVAYRFTVANRSKDKTHTVLLHLPHTTYGTQVTAGQEVTVSPGAVTTVSMLQPALQMSGEDFGVEIDGKTKREISFNPVRHGARDYWDDNVSVCILTSKSLARNFQDAIDPVAGSLGGNSEIEVENSESPVSQWAENWLAYSRYDMVLVSSDELGAMPAAVREAVMRYVACGGTLMIAGSLNPPKSWLDRHYEQSNLNYYSVGFGTCIIAPQDMKSISTRQWTALHANWWDQAKMLASTDSISNANRTFPIVENLHVPVGGMLAVMLGFVILAGPVNLTLLSRFRKRMWMFLTVPAISLVTCLSVFLYAFIAEGWDGRARTAAITILDQHNHRAATIGWTAFYSPMTPGGGLHFSRETEITPQWKQEDDHYYRGDDEASRRGELHTDWTRDQHLLGSWVSARVPAHFGVRKAETRRERLNVTVSDNGSITVVNGLGAKIETLYLANASGQIYTAIDIEPGAQAELTASPKHNRGAITAAFSPDQGVMSMIRTAPPYTSHCTAQFLLRSLRPNCYVADLEGSPFVEDALDGAEQSKSHSVVYGVLGDSGGS